MDREEAEEARTHAGKGEDLTRREFLGRTLAGAGCLGLVLDTGSITDFLWDLLEPEESSTVFKGDAPGPDVWAAWKARGWVKEGRHYLKLGRNVQCKVCPNDCLLEPGDRSHCRNRVNMDGTLYTMAYANPCTFHVDPIEKKPLLHFLPSTGAFSIAISGCGFRCLNCQNWEISQKKPEETKDPRGPAFRVTPATVSRLRRSDLARMTMLPEDVVALALALNCRSVAYTYSEPTVWHEYMADTAKLARARGLKNVWVTCGYITSEALADVGRYLDAANVDLKSFDPAVYKTLNTGKLEPVLDTLKMLDKMGVWFEVTNLVVPTYTDNLDMIRRMCDWLVDNVGPDYPLHFSRFHPAHKLTHLPPTPVDFLIRAREVARNAGLHHVYIGNVRGVKDAETTFCPVCGKAVVERDVFSVTANHIEQGKCAFCQAPIAGVWQDEANGGSFSR